MLLIAEERSAGCSETWATLIVEGARAESKSLAPSESLAEDSTGGGKTDAPEAGKQTNGGRGGYVAEPKSYCSFSFDARKGALDGNEVEIVGVVRKRRRGGVVKLRADVAYISFLHDVIGVSGIGLDEKERSGKSPMVDAGVVKPDGKEWVGRVKSK